MNSIEEGHICKFPNLEAKNVSSFVGNNLTLEIDKGERPPFSYKKGSLPLG